MTAIKSLTLAALAAFCLIAVLPESGFAGIIEYKKKGKTTADVRYDGFYLNFKSSNRTEAHGYMNGLGITYTNKISEHAVIRPEFRYAEGSVRYEGPLTYSGENVSSSGRITHKGARVIDGRFLLGYETRAEKSSFTSYTGLGARYFALNLDKTVTDAFGNSSKLDYVYMDAYIPLGVRYAKHTGRGWWLGITAEGDISFEHPGALGAAASAEMEKKTKIVNVAMGPYVRYWRHNKVDRGGKYSSSGVPERIDEAVTAYDHKLATITDPGANVFEFGVSLKLRF